MNSLNALIDSPCESQNLYSGEVARFRFGLVVGIEFELGSLLANFFNPSKLELTQKPKRSGPVCTRPNYDNRKPYDRCIKHHIKVLLQVTLVACSKY